MKKNIFYFSFYMLIAVQSVKAQNRINETEKRHLVDSIAMLMKELYVFPKIGEEIAQTIQSNLNNKKYDFVQNPLVLAKTLTDDMRSVNHDKHISVRYDPISISRYLESIRLNDNSFDAYEDEVSNYNNHGFKDLKILNGNIGYLKLTGFSDNKGSSNTCASAMKFLYNTDAIIIDLRENRGGSPDMVQLIASYFFGNEPTHLNTIYNRPNNSYHQIWSLPFLEDKMPQKDLYILISNKTFSAAEGFTYIMKQNKRATIIGETTGGAAHLVDRLPLNKNFYISLPTGRSINPISKTNWEGVGVQPDILIKAENALLKSHQLILEKLKSDEYLADYKKMDYEWEIDHINSILNPLLITKKEMKSCVGEFKGNRVFIENSGLYYLEKGQKKMKMIPIRKDYFRLEENPSFRIEIIQEENTSIAIQGHYINGKSDWFDKNE